jgi:hypothetical protein
MILDLNMRTTVSFDPTNRQHRQWFAEFQKTRTWGRCPVRFVVPSDSHGGDLVSMIQKVLLAYYVTREFKKTVSSKKVKTS